SAGRRRRPGCRSPIRSASAPARWLGRSSKPRSGVAAGPSGVGSWLGRWGEEGLPMKLECEVLELRTRHPFHIARAAAPPARRSVMVRVIDDDGAEGWGEAAATAFYGETAETVLALR